MPFYIKSESKTQYLLFVGIWGSGEVSAHNQVKLLYSSKTLEELVFRWNYPLEFIFSFMTRVFNYREDICSIADKFLQRSFFVTGSRSIHTGEIEARRINQSDIFKALSQFDSTKPTYCYICGPNQMILDVSSWLEKEGVLSKNIFYELWWWKVKIKITWFKASVLIFITKLSVHLTVI